MAESSPQAARAGTGIKGLDYVLGGGLPRERITLVHGGPGAGKTTLGFQFLLEGVRQGERCLYVTLLQTCEELRAIAASHHWSLEGLSMLELPEDIQETVTTEQTIFSTADVELHEAADAILQAIEEHQPQRMVLDSTTELAVLVETGHQLRRQLLNIKRKLTEVRCTTVFTAGEEAEQKLTSLLTTVHGMIDLQMQTPTYGKPRRHLQVTKMRGMEFVGGHHDFRILTGGLELYPQIQVDSPTTPAKLWEVLPSGNKELDTMLGGGLEEGTACLLTGTTGSGKSTLASLYVQAAAERGDHSAVFCFDERKQTFLHRSEKLNLAIPRYVEEGLVDLREYNVGDVSPGEFAQTVRQAVEQDGAKVIVIDSVTGYMNAMPDQRHLVLQLHDLLSYLSHRGVLTMLVVATHGLFGEMEADVDASYLADTVVLLRHFEAQGQRRRCIAVLKKRHGNHESRIREMQIDSGGMRLGPPLTQFSGVLTGMPTYHGEETSLMDRGQSQQPKGSDDS